MWITIECGMLSKSTTRKSEQRSGEESGSWNPTCYVQAGTLAADAA